MSQPSLYWVEAAAEVAWSQWWPKFCEDHKLAKEIEVQKFDGNEVAWPQVIDSLRSFSLFSKQKLILVRDAEKALKKCKEPKALFDQLNAGPYPVVLQASSKPPKKWAFLSWRAEIQGAQPSDEKAVFRWIDAIHADNLQKALVELQKSLDQGLHPLVFLQLLTRHYRLGRLIHHAQHKRLSDQEISSYLNVPPFVVQKWKRKAKKSNRFWKNLFESLHRCDLQLKSGMDEVWCLRKLTYDLIYRNQRRSKAQIRFTMTPSSLFEQKLWQVATSFS